MKTRFWLGSIVILLAPLGAQAMHVRVDGTVSVVMGDSGLLPLAASMGDPMSILYVIDDVGPADSSDDEQPDEFGYRVSGTYDGVVRSMTITVAGNSFTLVTDPTDPTASRQYSFEEYSSRVASFWSDQWEVSASAADGSGAPLRYQASASIFASSYYGPLSVVNADAYRPLPGLPRAQDLPPDGLAAFMNFGAISTQSGGPYGFIQANITSITPVPLPMAAWLLLSGLGVVGTVAARKI